jgi:hypothetical protein|tara:strand:- start:43 stop:231 length:189 start_codon:yes stop_codon:yes gene_type:complete
LSSGEIMANKIPDEIASELYKALNRLEIATELIKAWVGYMNTDLSETEKLLVKKSKEFLGEK